MGVLSSALAMSLVYVQQTTSYTIQALTPEDYKSAIMSETINILFKLLKPFGAKKRGRNFVVILVLTSEMGRRANAKGKIKTFEHFFYPILSV